MKQFFWKELHEARALTREQRGSGSSCRAVLITRQALNNFCTSWTIWDCRSMSQTQHTMRGALIISKAVPAVGSFSSVRVVSVIGNFTSTRKLPGGTPPACRQHETTRGDEEPNSTHHIKKKKKRHRLVIATFKASSVIKWFKVQGVFIIPVEQFVVQPTVTTTINNNYERQQ